MNHQVDVAIIGSGFSGSILAWILAKQGVRVALIDAASHPRFAIGESSTPIADMLLRRLGETYRLKPLQSLATWSGWQANHRDLACGMKRGFSYFAHEGGEVFQESELGQRSLLVAASACDEVSDTHWYRPELDAFLHQQACSAGAIDFSNDAVIDITRTRNGGSRLLLECDEIDAEWLIDASGRASVLAEKCAAVDLVGQLTTDTRSAFAHYRNVGTWSETHGVSSADPFDADAAAQHHLLDDGWLWMLRFNNGVTSVGFTSQKGESPKWSDYPSIATMMSGAKLVAPTAGLRFTKRLQRFFDPVVDDRRLMLPTAAVAIDPLHSTGIAHALAGVDRISRLILESHANTRADQTEAYRQAVISESRLLDRLVSTAYARMQDFQRFTTACMLYFAAAITCEERYAAGENPDRLWNADDEAFVGFCDWACDLLLSPGESPEQQIREQLQSWNTAGLMDPAVKNRYAYTATKS
ncbi:MAG: NAD(P)/FAD-dependent oxidoreductase [Rubripirellula sp.]